MCLLAAVFAAVIIRFVCLVSLVVNMRAKMQCIRSYGFGI